MKQATITGVQQTQVKEIPDPQADERRVLLKVTVAPLCTDYKSFQAGDLRDSLGHEAAGEVLETGGSTLVQAGQRVVVMPQIPCGDCDYCDTGDFIYCLSDAGATLRNGSGTVAQFMLKQDWQLVPVPDDISTEHASMACCGLGPTYGGLDKMGLDPGETLLITGMGPVGLGGVINANYRGARVIAVEMNPYRASLAQELGADVVLEPDGALEQILDLTDGAGVDKAMDCSGVVAAHRLCIDAVRRLGSVSFVGECSDATPLYISRDMIRKGLTLVGTWHYNLGLAPRIMQQIRNVRPQLDKLVTHRFHIDDIQRAFELQLTGQSGKVLIEPWGPTA
ncbi:MAG: zinc-binding dehydrogenase [Anaerolineaceae bacterium]|nr:zinc-binding dehydrogenase [Anaerolineaceae bacterium]